MLWAREPGQQAAATTAPLGLSYSAELIGDPLAFTGIYALAKVDLFNMLSIPEAARSLAGNPGAADVARFLVREMVATARRLMAEIHELASAYGWSERSIATMSDARQSAYLEMLTA
jgi:hypothetical protein